MYMKITRAIKSVCFLFICLMPVLSYGQYKAGMTSQDSLQFEIQNYVSGIDGVIKLTPAQPEPKVSVKFVYTGIFSDKLMPRFTVYFDKGAYQSLQTQKTDKGIEGKFTVPDSATSFAIRPTNNLRDSNEVLFFLVYRSGKQLPGALASAAINYQTSFYSGEFHPEIARLLYRREFKLHPELRPKFLLRYLEAAVLDPDSLIIREFKNAWRDSLQDAKSDVFLTKLYNLTERYRWLTSRDELKAQLLFKYPAGDLAFVEAKKELGKPWDLYEQKLTEMESKFMSRYAKDELDQIYSEYARSELNKGRLENAIKYMKKIQSKFSLKRAYEDGARILFYKGVDLDIAMSFQEKALELYAFQRMPFSDKNYDSSGLKYMKSGLLYFYGQILHKKNDLKGALQKVEQARFTESSDVAVNECYLRYLLEARDYKKGFSVADSCIKEDILSDSIKVWHRLAFLKLNADQAGYDKYYRQITDSVNHAIKLPDYSKFNLRSIDFTLNDLNGQPFKLSRHKGKTVVFYFFKSFNQPVNLIWNNEFNKVYNEFKNRRDLVLVGVDRTPAFYVGEPPPTQSRMQIISDFVKKEAYNFPVLIDRYHHDPRDSGNCYFFMSDTYSADSSGQFYVIDPKGMVRYKSYPVSNRTTADSFTRELRAAIKYGTNN
jgi:peroxiredoxin